MLIYYLTTSKYQSTTSICQSHIYKFIISICISNLLITVHGAMQNKVQSHFRPAARGLVSSQWQCQGHRKSENGHREDGRRRHRQPQRGGYRGEPPETVLQTTTRPSHTSGHD